MRKLLDVTARTESARLSAVQDQAPDIRLAGYVRQRAIQCAQHLLGDEVDRAIVERDFGDRAVEDDGNERPRCCLRRGAVHDIGRHRPTLPRQTCIWPNASTGYTLPV